MRCQILNLHNIPHNINEIGVTTWFYEPRGAPLHREGLYTLRGSVKIAGGNCGRDYCYSPDSTLKKSSVTKREHNRMLRLQSFAVRGEPERKQVRVQQFSCSLFVKPRKLAPDRPDLASRRSSLSRSTGAAPRENDWGIFVTFVVQRTVAPPSADTRKPRCPGHAGLSGLPDRPG